MDNKIIVILGMMRSGTSFFANWLNRCGLFLGDEMLPPDTIWNTKGFYEDIRYRQFCYKVEKKNMGFWKKILFRPQSCPNVTDLEMDEANNLINQSLNKQQWGWKVPFTTLLWNNVWYPILKKKNLENNLTVIIVFRHYSDVVESLLRVLFMGINAQEKSFKRTIKLISFRLLKNNHANKFLKEWINYNIEIIKFIELNPTFSNYTVVDISYFLDNSKNIYDNLTKNYGLNLHYINPLEIFEDSIINRKSGIQFTLRKKLVEDANVIYSKIQDYRYIISD